jgi:hypothetical protein
MDALALAAVVCRLAWLKPVFLVELSQLRPIYLLSGWLGHEDVAGPEFSALRDSVSQHVFYKI